MAATLVVFVVLRTGIAELARPYYEPPVTVQTQDSLAIDSSAMPTAWRIDGSHYVDASGRDLGDRAPQVSLTTGRDLAGGRQGRIPPAARDPPGPHYQPGDRFWTFEVIEATALPILALLILGFGPTWVVRRTS